MRNQAISGYDQSLKRYHYLPHCNNLSIFPQSEPRDGDGQQREGGARGWAAGTRQQMEEAAQFRGVLAFIPIIPQMSNPNQITIPYYSKSNLQPLQR